MLENLAEHYRELDDDALLRLSLDRDQLTPEAAQALETEMSLRGLTRADAEMVAARDRGFDRKRAHEQGWKTGGGLTGRNTALFGNWNVEKKLGGETYTATKFFAIGPFPLIPLGTYRLLRTSHRRWWEWLFGRNCRIVEKLPLDWNQVLYTWCKYGAIAVLFVIAVRVYLAIKYGS